MNGRKRSDDRFKKEKGKAGDEGESLLLRKPASAVGVGSPSDEVLAESDRFVFGSKGKFLGPLLESWGIF